MPDTALREVLRSLYRQLRSTYGPQGWWPIPSRAGTAGFDARGYHPGTSLGPRTAADRFEIALGAVLTQNTAWTNVEKAMEGMRRAGVRSPRDVIRLGHRRIAPLIQASGYFNQKAKKLQTLAGFLARRGSLSAARAPSRAELLSLWGIGPETADSILLYAFHVPVFVVDAYTRRLLGRIGILGGKERYEEVQDMFHLCLRRSPRVYEEFHALIVAHAKRHCRSRPLCDGCPVHPCAFHGDRARA